MDLVAVIEILADQVMAVEVTVVTDLNYLVLFVTNAVRPAKCLSDLTVANQYIVANVLRTRVDLTVVATEVTMEVSETLVEALTDLLVALAVMIEETTTEQLFADLKVMVKPLIILLRN